jgi:hypothetical protein
MYWLNYLDRNAIALARLNDLEEDLNLTGTRTSININQHHITTLPVGQADLPKLTFCRVPDLCFHLVRWLHPWPSAQQHVPHQDPTQPLHGMLPALLSSSCSD